MVLSSGLALVAVCFDTSAGGVTRAMSVPKAAVKAVKAGTNVVEEIAGTKFGLFDDAARAGQEGLGAFEQVIDGPLFSVPRSRCISLSGVDF